MPDPNLTIAYIDCQVGDEILEVEAVAVLPRCGQTVTFACGEAQGCWIVVNVKPVADVIFDALVLLARQAPLIT